MYLFVCFFCLLWFVIEYLRQLGYEKIQRYNLRHFKFENFPTYVENFCLQFNMYK